MWGVGKMHQDSTNCRWIERYEVVELRLDFETLLVSSPASIPSPALQF